VGTRDIDTCCFRHDFGGAGRHLCNRAIKGWIGGGIVILGGASDMLKGWGKVGMIRYNAGDFVEVIFVEVSCTVIKRRLSRLPPLLLEFGASFLCSSRLARLVFFICMGGEVQWLAGNTNQHIFKENLLNFIQAKPKNSLAYYQIHFSYNRRLSTTRNPSPTNLIDSHCIWPVNNTAQRQSLTSTPLSPTNTTGSPRWSFSPPNSATCPRYPYSQSTLPPVRKDPISPSTINSSMQPLAPTALHIHLSLPRHASNHIFQLNELPRC